MTKRLLMGLLACTLLAAPAMAADDEQKVEYVAGSARAMRGAPIADGQILDGAPSIEFGVTQEKQVVTLNYSILSVTNKPTSKPDETHGSVTNISFRASATLKDGQADRTLLSLNGFTSGTSFGVLFAHSWTTLGRGDAVKDKTKVGLADAIANCKADPRNEQLRGTPQMDKECSAENGGEGNFVSLYNQSGFQSALEAQFKNSITPFVGFDLTGNQDSYEYLDRPTFSLKKQKHIGYEARAYVGGLSRDHPFGARLSLTFARKYDEGDPINLCQTTSVPGQTQCLNAADGAPTLAEQRTVGAQAFWAFGNDSHQAPRFGFAPSVSYDWHNQVWEVTAPLYFARNKDRELSGGIRLNYISEPDPAGGRKSDLSIGLFIGVPLGWGL